MKIWSSTRWSSRWNYPCFTWWNRAKNFRTWKLLPQLGLISQVAFSRPKAIKAIWLLRMITHIVFPLMLVAIGGIAITLIFFEDIGNFLGLILPAIGNFFLYSLGILGVIFAVIILLPCAIVVILLLATILIPTSPIWIPVGAYIWIIYNQLTSSSYPWVFNPVKFHSSFSIYYNHKSDIRL